MSTYALGEPGSNRLILLGHLLGALASVPPTSIVGAILWTGYLGNIVVTHLSVI